jgi:DNA-binding response OmpR family regulator
MVTTEIERHKVIKAIGAGAKNYLMKPFTQEELVGKILECLGMGV